MTNKLRALEIELEKARIKKSDALINNKQMKAWECVLKIAQINQNIKKERERLNAD